MTSRRQHPDELCQYCARFRDGFCHLDDLAPCRPVIRGDGPQPAPCTPEETERAKTRVLAFVVAFFLAIAALLLLANRYRPADRDSSPVERREPVSTTAILRERNRAAESPLSEWQLLTLAIMYTESRFQPDALGTAQDSGILQLRPCYVQEVNRLAGTHYTPEDAFDPPWKSSSGCRTARTPTAARTSPSPCTTGGLATGPKFSAILNLSGGTKPPAKR